MEPDGARWNHNIHYHPLVLAAVPPGARRALDVGCGEGMLVRALSRTVPEVIGLDPDPPSLKVAVAHPTPAGPNVAPAGPTVAPAGPTVAPAGPNVAPAGPNVAPAGSGVAYVAGDLLTHPFAEASFDLVASIATLHHLDAETALTRMRDLLRPGGRLVVIGLAHGRIPADLPMALAGAIAHHTHVHLLRKRFWEHPSPKLWPPPLSYPETRRLAEQVLPGVRYRRHLLWRFSLTWMKPSHKRST